MNFRLLSGTHAPELSLFELAVIQDFIKRHDGEQLLALLNVQPDNNGLVHFSTDWRHDLLCTAGPIEPARVPRAFVPLRRERRGARSRVDGHLLRRGFPLIAHSLPNPPDGSGPVQRLLRSGLICAGCCNGGSAGLAAAHRPDRKPARLLPACLPATYSGARRLAPSRRLAWACSNWGMSAATVSQRR